ncbi:5192_t:CDS:2, partial [Diversispora eburnea]
MIKVGQEPNVQLFYAHSIILRVRCEYFNAAFGNSWVKTEDSGRMIFEKPNIKPIIFDVILRYIYSGILNISNLSIEQILELLIACDELCIQYLLDSLQSYLIDKHSKWIRKNLIIIYQTCFHHSSLSKLFDYFFETVTKNPNPQLLFTSPKFYCLDETELLSILQRKELTSLLSQGKIWDYVLRWGIYQHSELPTNLIYWNAQDFEKLKRTLKECISLIKFNEMSVKEFYQKVQPYAFILDANIYHQIHLKHSSIKSLNNFINWKLKPEVILMPQKIESMMLNEEQVKLIISWINRDNLSSSTSLVKKISNTFLKGNRRNSNRERGRRERPMSAIFNNNNNLRRERPIKNSSTSSLNDISQHNYYNSSDSSSNLYYYTINPKQSTKNSKIIRAKEGCNTIRQHQSSGPNFFCLRLCSNNKVKCYLRENYNSQLHEEGCFEIEDYE